VIVALVVVSAFLHAMWNALLRIELDKRKSLIAAISIAMVLAGTIAAARWAGNGEPPFATIAGAGWAIAAGVLEWVYFTSLARALERGTLGTTYTISRGGSVVLVWPLSMEIYGEQLTTWSVGGSAVVLTGLALSGFGAGGEHRHHRPGALAWAILCAVAIASYHLAYKAALGSGSNPSAVFAASLAVVTAINLVVTGRAGRRVVADFLRARLLRVAWMGVVCGGSFLIFVEALSAGGAGFVLTLRNTSVLFATGMAWLIGERPRPAQIIGAALVAAGAVLMAHP
jgi:drug/metabolite transporter (DMT)-like permease